MAEWEGLNCSCEEEAGANIDSHHSLKAVEPAKNGKLENSLQGPGKVGLREQRVEIRR